MAAMATALLLLCSGIAWAQQDSESGTDPTGSSPPAKETGGPEIAIDSTATSETFQLPDGKLETRIYQTPVNYPADGGEWKPIGERLRGAEGATLSNGPNDFEVVLPEQIDSDPAQLTVGDEWVASEPIGIEAGPVELEGETASYEATDAGISFDYTGLSNGLKENIEINDPSQSAFAFDLSASEGLTPSLEDSGAVLFRDESGKIVATLPAPKMYDSAPQPEESRAVRYELGPEQDGHWRLTVRADRDWLEQPQRSFPASIDPTIVTGPPYGCVIGGRKGQTGWIDCASWGRETFLVGYTPELKSAEDEWWRTLMKFDTAAIPPTAQVSSATFKVRSTETALNTKGVELRKVTKPWTWQASWSQYDGPTHLWTTEGGDYSELLGEVLTSKRGNQAGWWEFPLPVKTVEEEATAGKKLPVEMKLIDDKVRECGASCTNRKVIFDSGAAKTEANRPYLSVIYTVPSSQTPVASYFFEEGSGGTAHDASGKAHEGTLKGAKWTKEGKYGGGIYLDGKEDLVTVPPSRELDFSPAFTLEAWVRPDEANEWSAVVTKETPGLIAYQLHAEAAHKKPAGVVFNNEEKEAMVEGAGALTPKAWSYLALTSDGVNLRLYINGALVGTSSAVAPAGGEGALQIGGDVPWAEDSFKGTIDNIRLYNRNLSAEEIKKGEGPPPTVVTGLSANTNTTTGTLAGTVNPNGQDTTFHFDYGLTTAYGSKTPSVESHVGSGSSPVAVSGPLSNLTPNSVYHYRLVGTNESGTTFGADKTMMVDQTEPSMTFASTYSAATPDHYGLEVQASDPGTAPSGLKSLTILVNGVVEKTENFSCPQSQCPTAAKVSWTHTFSHALDGSDHLTVLTLDDAGNATSAAFDLPSQVVHATSYTANPAIGGTKISEEWTQLHTHNSRVQESNETSTRGNAECSEFGSKAWCGLLRKESSDGQYSQVSTPISRPLAISEAGALSLPGQTDFGQSVASGPISEVRESWQSLPPGAGPTYEKLVSNNAEDKADNTVATEWIFWVDSATKLPIKESRKNGPATPVVSYFSYDSSLLEAGDLPATFFLLAPPTKEQQGCIPKGQLGGWSYSEAGMTYPDPRFNSLVNTATGPVFLRPEGAAVDGYDSRARLTAGGVELTAAGPDEQPLHWEVAGSPDQTLEAAGSSVIVMSEGGTPSAIIGSSLPKTMSVVDGAPDSELSESGDEIVLQPTPGANAEVQAISPENVESPCVTKAMIDGAATVHKEAEAAGVLMSKPESSASKTTTIGVWVNPHPALSGVSVTDKYGRCNGPSTKTVGSDGHVEWGGCPVGSSVTITAPPEVSAGGVSYVVPDSSRTISPPSYGWTISFDYNALPGSPPPPLPPPPAPAPNTGVIGLQAATTSQDDEAEALPTYELVIPPEVDCLGKLTRPYKSDTPVPNLFTAEGAYRFKCHTGTFLASWFFNWHIDRWDAETETWVERNSKKVGGPGPAINMQGPYYISAACRGNGVSLADPTGKKWRSGGKEFAIFENPSGDPRPIEGYGYKTFPCG